MRYLGIDYGTKRVGLALSDPLGKMAFPNTVLPNDKKLLPAIKKLCAEKEAGAIVLGESNGLDGKANPLMKKIAVFKEALEKETGLPVFMEPEFYTSAEAGRLEPRPPAQSRRSGLRLRRPGTKNEMLDASAAALILKSYLEKTKPPAAHPAGMPETAAEAQNEPPEKISFDQFKRVEMRVGRILSAEKVPNADKLLKLSVDLGEKIPRQIVSGIAPHFPEPGALAGKRCLFVTNLEPRVIRGFESNGMLLAVSTDDGTFSLLEPSGDIPPGTAVK